MKQKWNCMKICEVIWVIYHENLRAVEVGGWGLKCAGPSGDPPLSSHPGPCTAHWVDQTPVQPIRIRHSSGWYELHNTNWWRKEDCGVSQYVLVASLVDLLSGFCMWLGVYVPRIYQDLCRMGSVTCCLCTKDLPGSLLSGFCDLLSMYQGSTRISVVWVLWLVVYVPRIYQDLCCLGSVTCCLCTKDLPGSLLSGFCDLLSMYQGSTRISVVWVLWLVVYVPRIYQDHYCLGSVTCCLCTKDLPGSLSGFCDLLSMYQGFTRIPVVWVLWLVVYVPRIYQDLCCLGSVTCLCTKDLPGSLLSGFCDLSMYQGSTRVSVVWVLWLVVYVPRIYQDLCCLGSVTCLCTKDLPGSLSGFCDLLSMYQGFTRISVVWVLWLVYVPRIYQGLCCLGSVTCCLCTKDLPGSLLSGFCDLSMYQGFTRISVWVLWLVVYVPRIYQDPCRLGSVTCCLCTKDLPGSLLSGFCDLLSMYQGSTRIAVVWVLWLVVYVPRIYQDPCRLGSVTCCLCTKDLPGSLLSGFCDLLSMYQGSTRIAVVWVLWLGYVSRIYRDLCCLGSVTCLCTKDLPGSLLSGFCDLSMYQGSTRISVVWVLWLVYVPRIYQGLCCLSSVTCLCTKDLPGSLLSGFCDLLSMYQGSTRISVVWVLWLVVYVPRIYRPLWHIPNQESECKTRELSKTPQKWIQTQGVYVPPGKPPDKST